MGDQNVNGNIILKMDLQEVGWECVKLLSLAEYSKYPLTDGCECDN